MTFSSYTLVKKEVLERFQAEIRESTQQLSQAVEAIQAIEEGHLETSINLDGSVGQALDKMRQRLLSIAEEERHRQWASEGLNHFVEILRSARADLHSLAQDIIRYLVKYLEANQGGFFVVEYNERSLDESYIRLEACYAYNRQKHLERTLAWGEGVIGQAVIEREPVYMSEIPDRYTTITSGLGEATARYLFVSPLIFDNKVYGVIELASFQPFEPHHREFMSRISESIASTLNTVRTNEKTTRLLQESQQQAEQLRAQEEEMRQNMEELAATQEEMERKNAEVLRLLDVAKSSVKTGREMLLNDVIDPVIQMGRDNIIQYANPAAAKLWGYSVEEMVGQPMQKLTSPENARAHEEGMKRYIRTGEKRVIGKGREVSITTREGRVVPVMLTLSEVETEGEHFYVAFFKDLSEIKQAQQMMQARLDSANNAGIAYVEFDTQARIVNCNYIFAESMGFASADELKGLEHKHLVTADYAASEAYRQFWDDLRAGKPTTGIFERRNRLGQPVWLRGGYSALRDLAGNVVGIVKMATPLAEGKPDTHPRPELDAETIRQRRNQLESELLELRMKAKETNGAH